eukprot:m.126460 g.126460  ORF g.126460 m.126460 type:complete len:93 (-) comp12994_c1_seq2:138-416(-)
MRVFDQLFHNTLMKDLFILFLIITVKIIILPPFLKVTTKITQQTKCYSNSLSVFISLINDSNETHMSAYATNLNMEGSNCKRLERLQKHCCV